MKRHPREVLGRNRSPAATTTMHEKARSRPNFAPDAPCRCRAEGGSMIGAEVFVVLAGIVGALALMRAGRPSFDRFLPG